MEDNGFRIDLDKVIHERARLLILTYIAGSDKKTVTFNELKDALELTSGNLSIQLKNLEDAGYIKVLKKITKNKPETRVSLTVEGLNGLKEYMSNMEKLLNTLKEL